MKKVAIVVLIALVSLSFSCRRGDKTKIIIEKSTAEKIELPDKLKVTNDLKSIRDGIIVYQTLNEKFPESLDELDLDLNYPDEYKYDSRKGIVKSKIYPNF